MSNHNLSKEAEKLLSSYKRAKDLEWSYNKAEDEKIQVHQVSSKIAFFYEKVRNTIDYKEENLLRKNAIERILKRRIMTEKNESDVAKYLVYELIRARYLPDKEIPEKRIEEIKNIIEKYTYLLNSIPDRVKGEGKNSAFDWIIGIASCEVEEKLVPHERERAIVDFAKGVMKKKIKVADNLRINAEEEDDLIFVAVLKGLIKSDLSIIRYRVFIKKNPDWLGLSSKETILKISEVMPMMMSDIDNLIDHRYSENFLRAVKKNLAYFNIFQEVLAKQGGDVAEFLSHHYKVEDAVKENCLASYKIAKTKLKRAAVRSILYIFLTKMALALIIELPFDKYIMKDVNYFVLGINILFPAFLMTMVVLTIKVPGKNNTDLIVSGIKEMLYDKYTNPPLLIKGIASRDSLFSAVFKILYLMVFVVSFGTIIWFLKSIGFNTVSIALFLFFLTVVSYFGIRISSNARELVVVQRKEGLISFIGDLFSIPILQVGHWFSVKLSSINILVFIFDFIIEAPFKAFVDIFEEWIYYIKEEKDKIG
jgi:hypothetical protein